MQKWRASPGTKGVTDPSALLQGITLEPEINHGQPTVRGLRYPVWVILELLASGMTPEEILADYPDLQPEDLQAVLLYAAKLSEVGTVLRVARPVFGRCVSALPAGAVVARTRPRCGAHLGVAQG